MPLSKIGSIKTGYIKFKTNKCEREDWYRILQNIKVHKNLNPRLNSIKHLFRFVNLLTLCVWFPMVFASCSSVLLEDIRK